jgi:hypothetical protein
MEKQIQEKIVPYLYRPSDSFLNKIREMAESDERSLNKEITVLLKEAILQRELCSSDNGEKSAVSVN